MRRLLHLTEEIPGTLPPREGQHKDKQERRDQNLLHGLTWYAAVF